MEKVSLQEFIKKVSAECGDNADAFLLIGVYGNRVSTCLAGVDRLMIGRDAVKIAAAMQDVLDTKLYAARAIHEKLNEEGDIKITSGKSQVIPDDDDDFSALDAFLDSLNNLFEGENHNADEP